MFSIFKRLKNHFILSSSQPSKPRWELSELLSASPGLSSGFADKKLTYAKKKLQEAYSASDYQTFYTNITQAREALSELIPYEHDLNIAGPLPSQMLHVLQKNETQLRQSFEWRMIQHCNFDALDGHQFEEFCAAVLRKNGYTDVTVTKESGDQGIDIIAIKNGLKYAIQCKCYKSNIGNKAVQEAYTGARFYDCPVGVVLTNRDFTKAARTLANKNGVLLWNRDYLQKLLRCETK